MTRNELTDLIYDTLMKNVGMSEHHKELPLEEVTVSSVAHDQGWIHLHFRSGEDFHITIKEVK